MQLHINVHIMSRHPFIHTTGIMKTDFQENNQKTIRLTFQTDTKRRCAQFLHIATIYPV